MGPDAMTLVFWMLSFKPTFSLFSFTFIKRLFSFSSRGSSSPPPQKIQNWVNGTLSLDVYVSDVSEKVPKNKPVHSGHWQGGNWELREGSKGSFFTLTSFVHFTHCTICTHYLYLNVSHNTRTKVLQNASRLHPTTCLPSSKKDWWAPAEPGQPVDTLNLGYVGRGGGEIMQSVSRAPAVGESLSGVLET